MTGTVAGIDTVVDGGQQEALREYTQGPVRQGRLESPWERLVGGCVLGDRA